jgi:DNA-binding GntR family transcriptional regulator
MIDPAIQISEGKRGLSSRLYNDLLNSIITGDLPRGSHLPTEHQLSEDYGVSRTTVRAALARLKEEGYIESKQGSGTYVAEDPHISDMKPFAPGRKS